MPSKTEIPYIRPDIGTDTIPLRTIVHVQALVASPVTFCPQWQAYRLEDKGPG